MRGRTDATLYRKRQRLAELSRDSVYVRLRIEYSPGRERSFRMRADATPRRVVGRIRSEAEKGIRIDARLAQSRPVRARPATQSRKSADEMWARYLAQKDGKGAASAFEKSAHGAQARRWKTPSQVGVRLRLPQPYYGN